MIKKMEGAMSPLALGGLAENNW